MARNRVRLTKSNRQSAGHHRRQRRKELTAEQQLAELKPFHEARDKAAAEAPRIKKANGEEKIIHGHAYKKLLEVREGGGSVPSRVHYSEAVKKATNLPKFMADSTFTDKMCEHLVEGYPPTTVCRYMGIRYATFKSWLKIGQIGQIVEYAEFQMRISQAEAEAEIETLKKLKSFEDEEWRVPAWMLERRWPEHWARRDATQSLVKFEGEIAIKTKEGLAAKVVDDPESREMARTLLEGVDYEVIPSGSEDEFNTDDPDA